MPLPHFPLGKVAIRPVATLCLALAVTCALGWAGAGPTAHAAPDGGSSLRAAADRARTKVVILKVVRPTGRSAGTGFLAAPNLVVTAGHVVADVKSATAWVNGVSYSARVVGRHPDVDLAALRLQAPELLLKPVELAPSVGDLAERDALFVLAGPSQGPRATGDPATRTVIPAGFESRLMLQGVSGKPVAMISMRASVRKGDSGSPVLRAKDSRVVGVLSSRELPDAAGISHIAYAVPVDLLHVWLRSLPAPEPADTEADEFYLKRK